MHDTLEVTCTLMPKYVYECKECGFTKEVVHSMQEKLKDCEECDTIETLMRVPSFNFLRSLDADTGTSGSRVKDFIEESKSELKEERKELQRKEYSND